MPESGKEVLLLTQVLPYPPDSGPRVKTYNVLKYLARRHQVTLLSYRRASAPEAALRHLEGLCKAVYTVPMKRSYVTEVGYLARSLLTNQPWVMARDDHTAMRAAVDRLARQTRFDVVHADQLNMAQFALRVNGGAHRVLDLHNALWKLYCRLAETLRFGPRKLLAERDWRLLQRYEGEMCRRFDSVLAVSEADRRALIEVGARDDVMVIPIAIDTDEVTVIARTPARPTIMHIGTMDWPANVDGILWFLHDIFPRVKAQVPDVRCVLIGARPPHEIVHWGQTDPSVEVTGYVEDPSRYLRESTLMVVPLRSGGGMRVKILNALAQGIPLVTTTIGGEGIAIRHEEQALIADEPEAFADAVVRLLTDPALAGRLAANGRLLAEMCYDYRLAFRPLDTIYGVA